MGVLCTWVKFVTDLQTVGCELHKNGFGGRIRWGAIATDQPLTAVHGKTQELPADVSLSRRRTRRD